VNDSFLALDARNESFTALVRRRIAVPGPSGGADQLAAQAEVMPSALPVPWKPNSVDCPAATLPL
jgi:hypothetical protein